MPFNLLLLPLLAGFILLTRCHLFAYLTAKLNREYLLVQAATCGLCFLVASRIFCYVFELTQWGHALHTLVGELAPFPYFGSAIGAPILALSATSTLNYLVPKVVAGDWLYHANKFDKMESLLLSSSYGVAPLGQIKKRSLIASQTKKYFRYKRFSFFAAWRTCDLFALRRRLQHRLRRSLKTSGFGYRPPVAVMLTMTDGKVYVGFASEFPPVDGGKLEFVRIIPLWSGYRDKETKEVLKITSYTRDLMREDFDVDRLTKVLPCSNITSASLYEEGLFAIADGKCVVKERAAKKHGQRMSTRQRILSNEKAKSLQAKQDGST